MKGKITHEDKIFFPKERITKGELIDYYKEIAPLMLPLIKDRPISMQRFPNGIDKEGFIQKKISENTPTWIATQKVQKGSSASIEMLLCNDVSTLIYLANQGCITPHIWLSKKNKPRFPDRLIFDLDPSKKDTAALVFGAKALKEILEDDLHLKAFLMSTGSRGLHVVTPLQADVEFSEVRSFAKKIADFLAEEFPEKFTSEQRIEKRKGRVFIDYMRNAYAQTTVAPYAVRALPKGPIATPLSWQELNASFNPQAFHLKNIKKRILSKVNPWAKINSSAASLKKAIKELNTYFKE